MIDLHCHSTFSDGTDDPETLARLAEEAGLTALALTDHDTLDGLPRFLAAQSQVKVRLIPGLELSCQFMGMELHVLGLCVDHQHSGLKERIEDMRQRRKLRNHQMVERLRGMGIPITLEEVADIAPSRSVSRIHFAKALVSRGAAGSRQDAFARIIGNGCPGHVPFQPLSPGEAARWISEAGGIAVVAHPGRSANRGFRWNEAMGDLKRQGVAGFEAYYGEYGPGEQNYYLGLAAQLDMIPCGGSDYHGAFKPGLSLGTGRGTLHIPDTILDTIEARLPRRKRDKSSERSILEGNEVADAPKNPHRRG